MDLSTMKLLYFVVFRNIFLVLLVSCSVAGELQVLGVAGGGAVVNGSIPLVVMDCHYILPLGREAGLVVKWYKDSNPRPVYQWILGSEPQELGLLRGRLDLHYHPSPNPLKAHSALAFVSPTTELSGDYTCRVATYLEEGEAIGSLKVYTPASEFDMKMSKPSNGVMTIACSGIGIFPKPILTLFKTDVNTKRRYLMPNRIEKDYLPNTRLHNVAVESSILGHQLIGETEFECVLSIPGTDYKLRETLLYYPGFISAASLDSGSNTQTGYSGSNKCISYCSTQWLTLFPLLVLLFKT